MATLRDIAQHCSLSVSTVSMALRDHRSISDETKRRVWEAQKTLGYKMPLRPLRSLSPEEGVVGTKDVICLLIDRDFDNPSYMHLFERLAEGAIERHWRPIYLSSSLKALSEGKIPPLLRASRVDGIIVSGNYNALAHQHLRKFGLPMVIIGRYRLGDDPWMACEPDLQHGIRIFLTRMLAFNHRKFGLFLRSGRGEYAHHLRRSYQEELDELGATSVGIASEPGFGVEGDLRVEELLDRGATAILTAGDPAAVFEVCARRGLKIPEQISIIGLSASHYGYEEPKLAAIETASPYASVALAKLDFLFRDPQWPPTRELLPMKLIPGASIGLAPEG